VPEFTVLVEVLTIDFGLVNRWDPPQFRCRGFGINEVEGRQHLTAQIEISAPGEAVALREAERQLRGYVAEHRVDASRVRLLPGRRPDPRAEVMPWQRAEVQGACVDLVWDSREALARVEIAERADTVAITLTERRDPGIFGYVGGDGVSPQRAGVTLAAPLGNRTLIDGATGRAPDDLGIWDSAERTRRAHVLALDLDQIDVVIPPDEIVVRS
jgi:hypothetical protein